MAQVKPSRSIRPPSGHRWVIVTLTAFVLLAVLYCAACYGERVIARAERAQQWRSPASQLASLQHGYLKSRTPATIDAIRRQLSIEGDNVDDYISRYQPESGRAPEVVVCAISCDAPTERIDLRLAFGIHQDVQGGADAWDFWFAPVEDGHWVKDPLRLLYRANPGQGSHWGLVLGEQTDMNAEFRENKIAGLHDLGDTATASFLQQIVDNRQIQNVDFIGAPAATLTNYSSFSSRGLSSVRPPYWEPISRFTERAGRVVSEFTSAAAIEMTPKDWVFVFLGVAALLGGLMAAGLEILRAWRAVLSFGYDFTLDFFRRERQAAKDRGEPVLWDIILEKLSSSSEPE